MTANGPLCGPGVPGDPDVVEIAALGESLVTFVPSAPGGLAEVPSFERGIGGAESNVACALAAAGHSARWIGRVGADGFGAHLVDAIGAYGVDVASVARDPERPTGIYFRTAGDRFGEDHEVAYYRAGSAASAMTVDNVDLAAARACRVLHLSGITAALSEGCRDLLRELTAPRAGRPLLSFDVNHRPGLWRGSDGPRVLLELARRADLVFVGDDEAHRLWGLRGAHAVRQALPEPAVVVVKRGAEGATAFGTGTGLRGAGAGTVALGSGSSDRGSGSGGRGAEAVVSVPAPVVEVVAAVGAGDAFAAGFLSAALRGLPMRDRLRHGHLAAAAALTVPGDLAVPPARHRADRLAALDDGAWGTLRLGPGWTGADARAAEEGP
ncbi:sugar kinase [Streptomyces sp. NPDC096198]|uniref:sugar kinase n=1 Tax=Streptomyces sp. NPDC096198 TaxID=3366080 RepID=UPI00381DD59B